MALGLVLGLAWLFSGITTTAAADLEYQVKAAYLYNFLRFIEWPSKAFTTTDDRYGLCILGRDPFGESLTPIATKTAHNRSIQLRHLSSGNNLRGCHLLFIGQSEAEHLSYILPQLRGTTVLTVSDLPGFAEQGGIIGFTLNRGKVGLEVNLASARRAGLDVSSKLLEVASQVYQR